MLILYFFYFYFVFNSFRILIFVIYFLDWVLIIILRIFFIHQNSGIVFIQK